MATKAADREPKRAPLNMRTTQTLRDRLAAEAAKNDRSLAQEVEARLEASFLAADLYATVRAAIKDDREVNQPWRKVFENHYTKRPSGQWAVDRVNEGWVA